MAMKVIDLSKKLNVSVEDILDQLRNLFVDAEDQESEIDDKIVALVKIKLGIKEPAKEPKKKAKPKVKKIAKKKTAKTAKEEDSESDEKDKKKTEKKTSGKKEEKVESPGEKGSEEKEEKKETKKKKAHKGLEKIEIIRKAPVSEEAEKPKAERPKEEKTKEKKETVMFDPTELAKITGDKGKRKHKAPAVKKVKKKQKSTPVIEVIETVNVSDGSKTGKGAKTRTFKKMEPVQKQSSLPRKTPQKIEMHVPSNVRNVALRINIKPNEIIQYLMKKGAAANINQDLEEDIVRDILTNFGYELVLPDTIESIEKELVLDSAPDKESDSVTRAPVVTFMGHVDHGKTSLLDYIRNTMVTKGEKGGITQHIGAYKVETDKGAVTFLDTPGHAAFTAMRARGANATDVVVLVVAADDGVMPQTKEAIDHARAAGVPIIVAINKCDLPGANPDRVKQDLQKEGIIAEDWGGETIMVEVSAVTGEGVDNLVEMLMLESEMLELKAKPSLRARGIVIESKKTAGQGVVVTLLVQNGTLHAGDVVLCGSYYGRIKALISDVGERIKDAPPATPVEVLGLQGVPEAGEEFFAVKDEKKAKTLAELKQSQRRKERISGSQRVSLEDLHARIMEGDIKELKIILKADVQGSIEALQSSLEDLSTSEVKIDTIHAAVGNINESDVMLAMVSSAVILGFHVKVDTKADDLAKQEKIDMHIYDVIYEAIADVKAGMEGLLEPEEKEVFHGRAKVLEIFPSKNGKAAGCSVVKGTIYRKDRVRVIRGEETIFEGEIDALKRFKDDVRDVREGFEFGISIKGLKDIKKDDIIESFVIEKVARRLER